MEVKILEEKKQRIVVELHGADHGLCNAIKKELWNDETVTVASYSIDHPLVGIPKVTVETNKDGEAKKALLDGIKRLKKHATDFKNHVAKLK